MKRFTRLTGTIAVAVVAGAVLVSTVMAAPGGPQGTATPVAPGSGYYRQGNGMGMRGGTWAGYDEEVATFLGMTQEQIQAERLAGKSLVQIAEAKGKTEQQLVSAILAAKRADLDKAVADKTITQAQADLMYQNMQQMVPQAVERTTTGPMSGSNNATPGGCPMWNDDETPGNGQQQNGRGGMMGGRGGMMRGNGRGTGSSS